MTHPQQLQTEICYIADDFLKHMSVLEMTLEVTTASILEATKHLPTKERKALQHVIERVSPVGLKNLLEAVQMTASRTNHLRTQVYADAAKALVTTIYTQKGVAGPTSERTFNNAADGAAAAIKEVASASEMLGSKSTAPITTPKPVITPTIKKFRPQVNAAERKAAMELYRQWALKCPLVKCLGKPTEPPSDTHLWVMACGYVMASKEEAQATLRIGLNALLWSTSDGVNVVEKVKRFTHPSSEGCVYVLNMSKTTTQAETNHLTSLKSETGLAATLTDNATWVMPEYPHLIVVELSPKYSKEHPFNGKPRKGWDAIKQYMDSQ
jgi:hypothetical protein